MSHLHISFVLSQQLTDPLPWAFIRSAQSRQKSRLAGSRTTRRNPDKSIIG
jgi:hypothetical protein